jgi:4-aminobutyrate aminotransferase
MTIAMETERDNLLERYRAVYPRWVPVLYEQPLELVRGEGAYVWDSEDRQYLDFFGGIATTISGHAVPEIIDALMEQASKLIHVSNTYLIRRQVELAEKLAQLSGIPNAKCFFVNSGTEAVEAALLTACATRGSNEVIALRRSYHGRSFTTIAVTGSPAYKSTTFSPLNVQYAPEPYCYRCPFGLEPGSCGLRCAQDVEHIIQNATSGNVAAMIAESIMGVAGCIPPPPAYFSVVKEILDRYGIPLISDEVQAGIGRAGGAFFYILSQGVVPDMIVAAKSLGNGLPIGVVIGRAELLDGIPGVSISTFGGNPLVMAGALANLDYLDGLDHINRAVQLGDYLMEGLRALQERHELIGDVRGSGLLLAAELVTEKQTKEPAREATMRAVESARERGLLVGKGGSYGNVLRIAPPVAITMADCDMALRILDEALEEAVAA